MKPVQQVFALVLEKLPGFKATLWRGQIRLLKRKYSNKEDYNKKEETLRNKEVKKIIFDEYLIHTNNMKNGNQAISNYFDNLL